jgi:UDP-glucuronate decarboxylase
VNIDNPNEFTISELAALVTSLTGGHGRVTNMPLPADDPRQRQPDITIAKSALGWQPRIALKDGLVPTIAYFRALMGSDAMVVA